MRRVLVGAYQIGSLVAYERHINAMPLEAVDVRSLFYGTMFQAGASGFVLPQGLESDVPDSSFVADRVTYVPLEEYGRTGMLVEATFRRFVPDYEECTPGNYPLWQLAHFLVDLLMCARQRVAMVTTLPLPSIESLEPTVPAELLLSIRNLLAGIERNDANLPIPASAVSVESVLRLNEILNSDLFSEYSAAHGTLDSGGSPTAQAMDELASLGRDLARRHSRELRLKRAGVGLLSLSSKLISAACGPLPGALADFAADCLERSLASCDRIVMYQLDELLGQIMLSRVKRLVDEHGPRILDELGLT